jgi:hypothetical protein
VNRGVFTGKNGACVIDCVVKWELVHIRQNRDQKTLVVEDGGTWWIGARESRVVDRHPSHREAFVHISILMDREADLFQVVLALRSARCFPRFLNGWQCERDQNGYDTDDRPVICPRFLYQVV